MDWELSPTKQWSLRIKSGEWEFQQDWKYNSCELRATNSESPLFEKSGIFGKKRETLTLKTLSRGKSISIANLLQFP